MPSSDVILSPSGSDPDAVPLPPMPRTPDPDPALPEPLILDETAGSALVGTSESGDLGVGSSTFSIPAALIVPDPIVGALGGEPQEAPPEAEGHKETGSFPAIDFGDAPAPPLPPASDSADALGVLNFGEPAVSVRTEAKTPPAKTDEDGVEIEYVNGPNWPMVVLASYASAVTLALIWFVILPRIFARSDIDNLEDAAPTAVGARGVDRSKKVAPAPAIAADRITALGEPLKVGQLEITPLATELTDVTLRRQSLAGRNETRNGGDDALALLVRLRNTSQDAVFAPLEPSFLRDPDDGVSDSFVELDDDRRVYLYPLAIGSEWSIVGQEFPDLRPGEVKETRIVTSANFPESSAGLTWRIKVRTGPGKTETIGVRVPGAR
jgi:hypothetical protein